MSAPAPVSLEIHDLSHDGRGVGRTPEGKACFVAGALPGEQVRWQQTQSKRSYVEGLAKEILRVSAERVVPRCAHYSQCGGCELQHLAPAAQLAWKEQQLRKTLERADLTPREWMPALAGDPWHYRGRTRLALDYGKQGLRLGYRARGSSQVVPIAHCDVLDERLNALLEPLSRVAEQLKPLGLDQIELSAAEQDLAACFYLKRVLDEVTLAPIAASLESIQLWQKLPGKPPLALAAYPSLQTELGQGLRMAFVPGQFVQVNAELNRAMVQQALDWLEPEFAQRALDLFCGSGNFSLPLATRCQSVVGVEGIATLCEQGRDNARDNGLKNVEFRVANLAAESPLGRLAKEPYDLVLLDPPREGAAEVMPGLKRLAPQKILYVSCHPAAMVRDLAILMPDYRLERVGAMDMFPHTTHLEAMALLVRKASRL